VEQKKDRKHRKAKLWASVEHSLDKASQTHQKSQQWNVDYYANKRRQYYCY